ncbi:MAG: hypothetical protein JXK93_08590 [Sphaerochaetaceae bacterium]|nr:hypothetical protein [Sphaerochaetaceae bacterium]
MNRPPVRQRQYLRPVTWLLSYPEILLHRYSINRRRMEGLKPPYLLLCTHHAFLDFKVTTAAIFPHRANYVVAIDGFIKREWLLRNAGGICKRKFTTDIKLISQIRQVLHRQKDILALYPEARYSLVGTNAVLPESLGKMIKLLKVPVVMLNMHGHYLNSPCWNLTPRGNRIEADLTQILTAEEIASSSVTEIFEKVNEAFSYDEYQWQKENRIRIAYRKRAEGLHKVLYKCPFCLTEYRMDSSGTELFCSHCGSRWQMSEYGELARISPEKGALKGAVDFTHIPSWYEWERQEVRREIEEGSYRYDLKVTVDALPHAKGFIRLGEARLTHCTDGFTLSGVFDGNKFSLSRDVAEMYSCHIEYEYFSKGDCIDLSTLEDTFYLFPHGRDFSVTKIALATEELYSWSQKEREAVVSAL